MGDGSDENKQPQPEGRTHGERDAARARQDPEFGPEGISLGQAALDHDPGELLRVLDKHGVKFVLVGGLASATHGSSRVTDDLDVTPEQDPANLHGLSAALVELNAQLRVPGLDHGVPFDFGDPSAFRGQTSMTLVTKAGFLDLAFVPDGTGGYDDLIVAAQAHEIFGSDVQVASLEDVVRSKRSAGRQKDLDALPELERLIEERRNA